MFIPYVYVLCPFFLGLVLIKFYLVQYFMLFTIHLFSSSVHSIQVVYLFLVDALLKSPDIILEDCVCGGFPGECVFVLHKNIHYIHIQNDSNSPGNSFYYTKNILVEDCIY